MSFLLGHLSVSAHLSELWSEILYWLSFEPATMKNFSIPDYVLTFFYFSFLGWVVESIYCSLGEGKLINRGFLTGPLCPIYGTGALVMLVLLTPFYEKPWAVILLGMVFCDIVEYITSFLMEKLFHARWWDYSNNFLNINGRICFKHTMYWGLMAFLYIYCIQPVHLKLFFLIPTKIRYIVLTVVLLIFIVDFLNTLRNALDMRKLLVKLQNISKAITAAAESFRTNAGAKYNEFASDKASQLEELRGSLEKVFSKYSKQTGKYNRRVYAVTHMSKTSRESIEQLREILDELVKRITDENTEMY